MPRIVAALLLFGISFGYLEAAVVVYLRAIYDPIRQRIHPERGPNDLFPLITQDQLLAAGPENETRLVIELGREIATIAMLAGFALVAGSNFSQRMAAFAVGVPWSFVMLPLVNTGSALWFAVAVAGTFAVAGSAYGPMAAFIPEIFATRYRYSGAGLALNLAGLIGGAVPTIVAAPILATWGVPAIGVMMTTVVLVSLVCTVALPETKGVALQVP